VAKHIHLTINTGNSKIRDAWSEAARKAAAEARKSHSKNILNKSSTGHTASEHEVLAKEHQNKADHHEREGNKGSIKTETHNRLAGHHERIAHEHRHAAHYLKEGDKESANLAAESAKERSSRNPLKR
jgi:hypothetical protein